MNQTCTNTIPLCFTAPCSQTYYVPSKGPPSDGQRSSRMANIHRPAGRRHHVAVGAEGAAGNAADDSIEPVTGAQRATGHTCWAGLGVPVQGRAAWRVVMLGLDSAR